MLTDGPATGRATLVLAHGAGAPMDTPFMTAIAQGVAAHDIRVVRFEFAYMARRRTEGIKAGPERMPALLAQWAALLDELGHEADRPLLIGGKSMGGRSAAVFAAEHEMRDRVSGVICLGYPFHPPGKPDKTRLEPLRNAARPTLIVQGERDAFGNLAEVPGYGLEPPVELAWLPDGDHSFAPRKRSGHTQDENLARAVQAMIAFADRIA